VSVVPELDALVEPFTAALIRLTDDSDPARGVQLRAESLEVQLAGESNWISVSLPGDYDLWDAQIALLFSMGFLPDDEYGGTGDLVLEAETEYGKVWEEQPLRECALHVLGMVYYVFDLRDAVEFELEIAES